MLRGIRHLLHAEGYTIKGVQKILREQGIDQVKIAARAALVVAKAEGGKKKRGRKVEAAAPKLVFPDAAPAVVTKAMTKAPSTHVVIAGAIRDLELARALLSGQQPASAAGIEPAKRSRAGRL